jgi:predicted ATPase/DNA-binding CsgD family transcriptional regulator
MGDSSHSDGYELLGRRRELQRLLDLVTREDVHLITITGMPGVGKTSLARAVLEAVGQNGRLVPAAAVADGRLLEDVFVGSARLSGADPSAGWDASGRHGGDRSVVVLDDVDRVDGLADAVANLLSGQTSILVVLTAIRPTHLPGEHLVRVAPLPVPSEDEGIEQAAIALFVERAAAAGVHLDLADPAVRADVIDVCRQAGGVPLAIVLAAAQTTTLPPGFIARTLWRRIGAEHEIRALPGEAPGRSLAEALDGAYRLVGTSGQQVLSQVVVFQGPFLSDAAAAVVELSGSDVEVCDVLVELVDAHLLEFDSTVPGAARFRMSALVRAYAGTLLDVAALSALRHRHARYFRARCLAGGEVVRREWADIAAALDHEMRNGTVDDALSLAIAVAPALQNLPGAAAALTTRLDDLLHAGAEARPELQARALVWSTVLRPREADDLAAIAAWMSQHLADATALSRESGDGPGLLQALELTIASLNFTLDLARGVSAAHEGLELAQRLDNQPALARFEAWVAMAMRLNGNISETARLATSAVTRGREHGDAVAIINGSRLLLTLPVEQRPDLDPPLPRLADLLGDCERSGHPLIAMTILHDLFWQSLATGDLHRAAGWSWRLLVMAGDRLRSDALATVAGVTAVVSLAIRSGDLDTAVRLRESVRPLEGMLRRCVAPAAAVQYETDCGLLTERVDEDRYALLAAAVAGCTVREANHRAREFAQRLAVPDPPPATRVAGDLDSLTPRERDVLIELASGATNRQIAQQLGLSAKTVMHHSMAIYRKLAVPNRVAATAIAYEQGLLRRAAVPAAG